jgi:Holliday junction resolvase RusA-like endonuclease
LTKTIHITPVPKPRMTRADKWKQRPVVLRYRAYCDELRLLLGSYDINTGKLAIDFYMPMPKSWSEKKKRRALLRPHKQKPDIDNLLKGYLDAVLEEDCHVHSVKTRKVWAMEGKIVLRAYD